MNVQENEIIYNKRKSMHFLLYCNAINNWYYRAIHIAKLLSFQHNLQGKSSHGGFRRGRRRGRRSDLGRAREALRGHVQGRGGARAQQLRFQFCLLVHRDRRRREIVDGVFFNSGR